MFHNDHTTPYILSNLSLAYYLPFSICADILLDYLLGGILAGAREHNLMYNPTVAAHASGLSIVMDIEHYSSVFNKPDSDGKARLDNACHYIRAYFFNRLSDCCRMS